MRLEQLQYFIEVTRHNSISRAANNVFLSQPALSAAIKALENELGKTLFKRTKKGLFLTEYGSKIYGDALQIVRMIDNWHQYKTEDSDDTINISCTPIISHYITPAIIIPFQKKHNSIRIFAHGSQHWDVIRILEGGSASLILTTVPINSDLPQQAVQRGWSVRHIFTDKRYIFMGKDHPYSCKSELSIDMLKNMDLAYYSDSHDQVSHYYAPYFKNAFRLANKNDILDLVVRNQAVFIQPYGLFSSDYRVKQNILIPRPIPIRNISADAPIFLFSAPELTREADALRNCIIKEFTCHLNNSIVFP